MIIPAPLVEAVERNECIAFVGAGFSAAARLPPWKELLRRVAREASPMIRQHVETQLDRSSRAHELDEAAQVLERDLGRRRFFEAVQHEMRSSGNERMERRKDLLRNIPFRAILTTNFDELLQGVQPGPEAYSAILRPRLRDAWDVLMRPDRNRPVLKLHGDLGDPDSVVFTRRGYRDRLYRSPGYREFLRVVFSNYTVLFLGYSLTDAYLSELRSECLALFEDRRSEDHVVAYALIPDVSAVTIEHLRTTERIEVIPFSSDGDYAGFDEILGELQRVTSLEERLRRLLDGKRILWVDAHPENNETFAEYFSGLGHGVRIDMVADAAEGLERFTASQGYDLVITHWGKDAPGGPAAVQLLEGMRRRDLRAPVLVFAWNPPDWGERKRRVMALGAQGYYFSPGGLCRAIERVFELDTEVA